MNCKTFQSRFSKPAREPLYHIPITSYNVLYISVTICFLLGATEVRVLVFETDFSGEKNKSVCSVTVSNNTVLFNYLVSQNRTDGSCVAVK